MKTAFIHSLLGLFLLPACVRAQCSQTTNPVTQKKIAEVLGRGFSAKEINSQIRERGVDFPAAEKIRESLGKLNLDKSTWALIVKCAPLGWKILPKSSPHIRQLAVHGGTILGASLYDVVDISEDHGDTWNSARLPVKSENVMSVAWCGSYWIAGARRNPSYPEKGISELSVFLSDDGRQWKLSKTWEGESYDARVLLACDGDVIVAGVEKRIWESSDRGSKWLPLPDEDNTEALAMTGRVGGIDALFRRHYLYWEYCSLTKDAPPDCHHTYPGMVSMARIGGNICVGGRTQEWSGVDISSNEGKKWFDVGIWPTTTEDEVETLSIVGEQVAAGTGWHGILLGNAECKSWEAVGASASEYAPKGIRSIVSDDRYLYAGGEAGVYRFPLKALAKKGSDTVQTNKRPH